MELLLKPLAVLFLHVAETAEQMMLRGSEMGSVSLVSALERCEADPMMTELKLGLEQDLHPSRGGTLGQEE